MPTTPSPTYERLRDFIARRMRMSRVYQPLMLMELLGHRLLHRTRQAEGGQGSHRNGISRYDQGADGLVGTVAVPLAPR